MKALIVYESMFGNTETVARAVAEGLGEIMEVHLAQASDIPSVADADLLVVGGPTHAFGLSRPATRQSAIQQGARPEAADVGLREFLDVSPSLAGVAAAAFDTRIDKAFMPGSAARRSYRRLRRLGCRMTVAPESFRVTATAGPLRAGEAERARRWAVRLGAAATTERHRV